jgi:uncharacterized membrane protein YkoI
MTTLVSAGILGATMLAAGAQTAGGEKAEAQTFLSAPQSLTQAIAAAEAKTGAKAKDASFESTGATADYEIELIKSDGTPAYAKVNAKDGTVTVLTETEAKTEGHEGENGEDNDNG